MNQEKIGKFISQCRKEQKLTQQELAEKLGVTEKSISNWENGRNMPDVSLFKILCNELNITVNELICGEKIEDNKYQEKSDENMVMIVTDVEKMKKKRRRLLFLIIIFLILIISYIIYSNILLYEKSIEYDSRVMRCYFEENELVYELQTSIAHTTDLKVKFNDETIIFINSKLAIKNRKHYNFEIYQNMAQLISRQNRLYGFGSHLDVGKNEKISVYYTESNLNKINKNNTDSIRKTIEKSHLMCSNN